MAQNEPLQLAQNEPFRFLSKIDRNRSNRNYWHGLNRNDWHKASEISGTIRTEIAIYNKERLHGLLGRITPMEKWNADEHLILMKKLTA